MLIDMVIALGFSWTRFERSDAQPRADATMKSGPMIKRKNKRNNKSKNDQTNENKTGVCGVPWR